VAPAKGSPSALAPGYSPRRFSALKLRSNQISSSGSNPSTQLLSREPQNDLKTLDSTLAQPAAASL